MDNRSFDEDMLPILCCPACYSSVSQSNHQIICNNNQCASEFPVINNIPILINSNNSLFNIDEIIKRENFYITDKTHITNRGSIFFSLLRNILQQITPTIGLNLKAEKNYETFVKFLRKENHCPRVLVIGGSIIGQGLDRILSNLSIEFIETDVSFGPRTTVICDAHNIPFVEEKFDGVIIQAVLEHVVDPYRCVEEIHRVLKAAGVVYVETPFMQQVHEGRYDFTRFTHLGHRRLFRKFHELESGAVGGPGMALAWSYYYFLLSFFTSRLARSLVSTFACFTGFWLKYFDYLLIDKPGAYDAASGYYFIGKKQLDGMLSDTELIQGYRGGL